PAPRSLHSFPTRRSSDLVLALLVRIGVGIRTRIAVIVAVRVRSVVWGEVVHGIPDAIGLVGLRDAPHGVVLRRGDDIVAAVALVPLDGEAPAVDELGRDAIARQMLERGPVPPDRADRGTVARPVQIDGVRLRSAGGRREGRLVEGPVSVARRYGYSFRAGIGVRRRSKIDLIEGLAGVPAARLGPDAHPVAFRIV